MPATQSNFSDPATGTFSSSSPATLYTRTIEEENCSGTVICRVAARRVSDGASKCFILEYGYKREGGDVTVFGVNVLSAMGTTTDLIALAALAVTFDNSGSDVRGRVHGLNGQAIDWSLVADGMQTNHVEE